MKLTVIARMSHSADLTSECDPWRKQIGEKHRRESVNWSEQSRPASSFGITFVRCLYIGIMLAIVVWCCSACRTRSEAKSLTPDSNSSNSNVQLANFRSTPGRTLVYHIKYTSESSTSLGSIFGAAGEKRRRSTLSGAVSQFISD